MVEGRKAIAGSVACGITSIEDAVEGLIARATVWWTLETTIGTGLDGRRCGWYARHGEPPRRGTRTMPAGGATKAICALWNMN